MLAKRLYHSPAFYEIQPLSREVQGRLRSSSRELSLLEIRRDLPQKGLDRGTIQDHNICDWQRVLLRGASSLREKGEFVSNILKSSRV
jgi:hypothetical protein